MRRILYKMVAGYIGVCLVVLGFGATTHLARAAQPMLQVTSSDNTTYRIVVSNADPYRQVDLYTRQIDTQLWTTYGNIGNTDASGYLSVQLNMNSYNPALARESYVIVNGVQSSIATVNGTSSGSLLTLSQTTVTVGVGQTTTVTVSGGSGSYYIASNSNPSGVSASISGNTLSLYGSSAGATSTIQICTANTYYSYGTNCATVWVSVSGSSVGNIWFSPANPTLYVGQSLAVSINSSTTGYAYPTYTSGTYTVTANTNPAVATASISGTVLNLYALQNGTTTITVAHSSLGWSGTVYVTVSGGSTGGQITFSAASPTLQVGRSASVTLYAPSSYYSSNFYLSSNSAPGVVTAQVSGQTLTLYGIAVGTSTVMVCQTNTSACGSVLVTVTSGYTPYTYASGQLLNMNGTVFIVYKNTMSGFTNAAAFLGLGFSFANVQNVGYASVPYSGYTIETAYAAHPWGSWVKNGQTVYFVHQDGLIPIPSYDVFLNNGGQDRYVVSLNSYDWQRPTLPLMTYGDYRMK